MKTSGNKRLDTNLHMITLYKWEVQVVVVVLGCNDAPLGGDRVL